MTSSPAQNKTAAALKIELEAAKLEMARLLNAALRANKGPTPEYKAAHAKARCLWRLWENALDVEAGRKPCFPVDEQGALIG